MPVELSSFTAKLIDGGVRIEWVTATETNNSGFSLERSRDEQNFKEAVYKKGKGTTTTSNIYNYIDEAVGSGVYYYRLKQIDHNGSFKYLSVIKVDIGAPKQFSLEQNYPNPFNPSTSIKFNLPERGVVNLAVFDVLGREVEVLINETKEAGAYEITFDAKNLTSGIYFYQLKTNLFSKTNKMILAR